jgi:hypothetical protein
VTFLLTILYEMSIELGNIHDSKNAETVENLNARMNDIRNTMITAIQKEIVDNDEIDRIYKSSYDLEAAAIQLQKEGRRVKWRRRACVIAGMAGSAILAAGLIVGFTFIFTSSQKGH